MEPGSQFTSVSDRNKIQVSKNTEAQMQTQEEKRKKKDEENVTVFLCYEGSLK